MLQGSSHEARQALQAAPAQMLLDTGPSSPYLACDQQRQATGTSGSSLPGLHSEAAAAAGAVSQEGVCCSPAAVVSTPQPSQRKRSRLNDTPAGQLEDEVDAAALDQGEALHLNA